MLNAHQKCDLPHDVSISKLGQEGFVLTPIPLEFRNSCIVQLAQFRSIEEAEIQKPCTLLQRRLKDWDLYQPYRPSELLISACEEYMLVFHNHFDSRSDEYVVNHTGCFADIVVRGPAQSTFWDANVNSDIYQKRLKRM
jgi:hypothetical protein